MELFRQVQWAYKFSDANVQTSYRNAVRGTPLMPRDLFLMAISGRMHRVIDSQGRSWWSVAAIQNISDSLDVVAQLPGQMLIRRADRWGPIQPGSDGQVLTWNITTGLPEWADAGSGGTAAWGSITGSLSAQADLEAALAAASASGAWGSISGSISDQTDLVAALLSVGATAEWGSISGSITDQADLSAALGTINAEITTINTALTEKMNLTGGNIVTGDQDVTGAVTVHGDITGNNIDVSGSGGGTGSITINETVINETNITYQTDILVQIGHRLWRHTYQPYFNTVKLWHNDIAAELPVYTAQSYWGGLKPLAAAFALSHGATAGNVDMALTDDPDVGLSFDSINAAVGENVQYATKNIPSHAADWTVTARVTLNAYLANYVIFGLVMLDTVAGVSLICGPASYGGPFIQIRRQTGTAFQANVAQRQINSTNEPVWLRIRYVHSSDTYFFDMSVDGKNWRSGWTSQTRASQFGANTPNKIGFAFYRNNGTAGERHLASCDYYVTTP